MTPQPIAAVAGRDRTVPLDPRHRHTSACFWHVDECRWQCVVHPGVGHALEGCTDALRATAASPA
jgi:hypothetical protein